MSVLSSTFSSTVNSLKCRRTHTYVRQFTMPQYNTWSYFLWLLHCGSSFPSHPKCSSGDVHHPQKECQPSVLLFPPGNQTASIVLRKVRRGFWCFVLYVQMSNSRKERESDWEQRWEKSSWNFLFRWENPFWSSQQKSFFSKFISVTTKSQ